MTNNRIASCSADKTVQIRNTTDWTLLQTYNHTYEVLSIAQIDGSTVASGDQVYIKVWSLDTGNTLASVSTSSAGYVRGLELLSNGLLASAHKSRYLKFWNYTSGSLSLVNTLTLSGTSSSVYTLVLIDSQYLAVGMGNVVSTSKSENCIYIYDYKTYTLKKTLSGHTNAVIGLKLLSSQYLLSGGWDYYVRIWDLSTYTSYQTAYSSYTINAVESFSGTDYVFGDDSYKIRYYNFSTGSQITTKNTGSKVYALVSF